MRLIPKRTEPAPVRTKGTRKIVSMINEQFMCPGLGEEMLELSGKDNLPEVIPCLMEILLKRKSRGDLINGLPVRIAYVYCDAYKQYVDIGCPLFECRFLYGVGIAEMKGLRFPVFFHELAVMPKGKTVRIANTLTTDGEEIIVCALYR